MQPESAGIQAGAAPAGRRRGGWRFGVTLTALLVGAAGLAASAAGVSAQLLPRRFTVGQQQQIAGWEMARRWRTMTAGEIFPAAVAYQLLSPAPGSASDLSLEAYRVGISPQTSCAAGGDPAAARVLAAGRCTAMLRATYADETDSMLVTVGVAVMPGVGAAKSAASRLSSQPQPQPGVAAAAFRATLSRGFGNRQRQLAWATSAGPYLIMSAAGFADGRPRVRLSADPYADEEMTSFAAGVADAVSGPLGAVPPPPRCPGAPGC